MSKFDIGASVNLFYRDAIGQVSQWKGKVVEVLADGKESPKAEDPLQDG